MRLPIAYITALAILFSGCATKKASVDSGGGEVVSSGDAPMSVQQISGSQPVVSSLSKESWAEIRSGKDPVKKMYATLAVDDPQGAEALARQYLEQHPNNVDALSVLTASLILSRKYELADYYAGRLAKFAPSAGLAYNAQGLAILLGTQNRLTDYRRAITHFQKSMESSGEIAGALNLGHLYLELGNAQAAAATFTEAVSRCGGCIHAQLGLGVSESRTGQYDRAKSSFAAVLKKDSDHAQAMFHLALVEKNGYHNDAAAESLLRKIISGPADRDMDIKRKANFVLRKMKARDGVDVEEPAPGATKPAKEDDDATNTP